MGGGTDDASYARDAATFLDDERRTTKKMKGNSAENAGRADNTQTQQCNCPDAGKALEH
eukprot:gene2205-627_t